MGEIVSLSKHRKSKERAGRRKQAEANRAKHGRTKAERLTDKDEARRHAEAHALLKFEPPQSVALAPDGPPVIETESPVPDKSGA